MKKLLLLGIAFIMIISGSAQERAVLSKELRSHALKVKPNYKLPENLQKTQAMPSYKNSNLVDEEIIGMTRYDLQTNTSSQNRIHAFEDGTIGGIWTMGLEDASGYPDRGTGYNYYDGSEWDLAPDTRIESVRTGWPSYAPYGENGELVVSHDFAVGSLIYLMREEKGTGDWSEDELTGPGVQISWNRSTTSGVDNSVMQFLYITWPEANGGTAYEGLNGALLYSRSVDGGASWEVEHSVLDGMTADEYYGFSADVYEWAESDGDNIAFLVGDVWIDMFLMKSTDGGVTWDKTMIWENPYPFYDFTYATDTFYCVDGAHHLAFDSQNKVHVVFGINRAYADDAGAGFWFPGVGGIGYWNEDMPAFSNDLNALNPYDHPDSELIEDVNLIGWSQDLNGNGTLDVLDDWGTYYIGFSSQPQIIIDDLDFKYVLFSSVTETYDNGLLNYRHLWARGSWGQDVWGDFVQLTSELIHIFDECAYPSAAPLTDDSFYLLYMADSEPGNSIQGTLHATVDNNIYFMEVNRDELIPLDVKENTAPFRIDNVSQNHPNPFSDKSYVNVDVQESCYLSLEVTNITGQVVFEIPERKVNKGTVRLELQGINLTPGIFFYSVRAGDTRVTKKMVIE